MGRNESSHLVIASLLANPCLNTTQIADITGYCRQTVSRVKKNLEKAIEHNQTAIAAYQTLLQNQMPADARAKRLKSLATQADRDATSLQTIQYVDSMLRLTPQTQQKKQDPDENRPMFVLPSATNVTVNITQRSGNGDREQDPGYIDIQAENDVQKLDNTRENGENE